MRIKFRRTIQSASGYQPARKQTTIAAIPNDVRTILDVGCGRGQIVNELCRSDITVLGLDLNIASLRQARCVGIQGDGRALPLEERSVDLVMLTECLEHLTDADVVRAASEAERVARRYLLITVPWRQNLDNDLVRCRCGHRFHPYGHLQRFDEQRLHALFPRFEVAQLTYMGERRLDTGLVPKIRHAGGRYASSDSTRCSRCGNDSFPPSPRNALTITAGFIEIILASLPVALPLWMLALYQRTDG